MPHFELNAALLLARWLGRFQNILELLFEVVGIRG